MTLGTLIPGTQNTIFGKKETEAASVSFFYYTVFDGSNKLSRVTTRWKMPLWMPYFSPYVVTSVNCTL